MAGRSTIRSRFMRGALCLFVLFVPLTLSAQSIGQGAPESEEAGIAEKQSEEALEREKAEEDLQSEEAGSAEQQTEEARERERDAEEDPLAKRQDDRVDRIFKWSEKPDEFKLYGSIRLRYRWTGDASFWGDDGSRIGVNGQWQYSPLRWLFGRIEAGVNLLDARDLLFNQGANSPQRDEGESLFLRLGYAGIETPNVIVSAGKNWSAYYRVSGFTDRFDGTGGSASGTYNADTDGGSTGTGRADRVLQARILVDAFENVGIKPFNLNVQVQHGEPIPEVPGANYGTTIGLSAVLATRKDLRIGLAYNRAKIPGRDLPSLESFGIDGDEQATVLGVRWFGGKWYLATTVARLRNHETTDEGIYYDGWGWEVYGHYNVLGRWWMVGGWNILEPDADQVQAGNYRVKYGVIGMRYSFKEFRRMLYANVRLDAGSETNGDGIDNLYTLGLQWDLP